MRSNVNLFIAALVVVLGFMSCGEKEVYDPELHYKIIQYVSPVDSVDQQHTWQLTEDHTYRVHANVSVEAQRLEIYSEDPITSSEAEMMARVFVSDGQTVTLTVSMPSLATTLYAAIVDKTGKYTVTSFSKSAQYVDFSNPIATQQPPLVASPTVMAYTYCYEEDYPEPGDYDYNDVVLRIALERTEKNVVDIHTTLSAVGGGKPLAGGLRLVGYRYQDIDSVVAKGGKTFNVNVPVTCFELFPNDNILHEGRRGEAVINLFNDAHWAMDDNLSELNGDFPRYKYNVSKTYSEGYDILYVKTVTHRVYFKSDANLNNLTFEMIDPFLMSYYVGGRVEIHVDEFSAAQTMFEYNTLSFKDLPWALKIPVRNFRYPLDGVEIGFRKKGYMFGAYMTVGHGFGEWCEDHRNYLDWYQFPEENQVY